MKVENKDAHRAANSHYFFATHVRDGDGSGDDVVMLLLTEKELERAAKRAEKNPAGFCIVTSTHDADSMLSLYALANQLRISTGDNTLRRTEYLIDTANYSCKHMSFRKIQIT